MTDLPTAKTVLDFWFSAGPKKWFSKDDAFDDDIARQFSALHEVAVKGQIDEWSSTPAGALALIIVLDQFSRNLHRNSPLAFATDDKALGLSQSLIDARQDIEFPADVRQWIYMPFMHAEGLAMQQRSVDLFTTTGNEENLKFAIVHLDIIKQFGRFPHRNNVLGRTSSTEELEFLASGGFAG